MRISFLFLFCIGILDCQGLECPQNGWSQAEDICYRIVHFPESFWSAYHHCETFGGNLLQLKNVKQVMEAIGTTMEGNADEFRIDGIANGTWYQRKTETLEHMHKDYELLTSLQDKTLTLNVQDGRVSGNTDKDVRIGFICEGGDDITATCEKAASPKKDECEILYKDVPKNDGATARLKTALDQKSLEDVKTALEEGADAREQLTHGLRKMDDKISKLLIMSVGCDFLVSFRSDVYDDYTMLNLAAEFAPTLVTLVLDRAGSDAFDVNSNGGHGLKNTPLHHLAQHCNLEGIEALIRAGANVNIKNVFSSTPLADATIKCEGKSGWADIKAYLEGTKQPPTV